MSAEDDQAALDLKMMAVMVGSSVASPLDVLRALCHGHGQAGRFDLSKPPEVIVTFEKMDLVDSFWELMRQEFSYTTDTPSVAGLLRKLFISELFHQTDGARMESLAHHQLPTAGQRNAVVFLTQWRDSRGKAGTYDAAAAAVAAEQKVGEPLATLDLETIKDVYTFWEAEKRVVSHLKERLLGQTQSVGVEFVAALASDRKAGHWLSGTGSDGADRRAIADAYDPILAAAELFALRTEHRHSLSFEAPGDLLAAYQKNLYRFDRLYRRFCTKAEPALRQGWDLLKTLAEKVERVYDQDFLQPLGLEWSRLLDEGFLGKWSIEDLEDNVLPSQQNFYDNNIRPHLAEHKRAFVIISDAFRYEAAKELTESLNGIYRMDAELSAMLGVLPSYTALGMACLLPHETITYSDKGDVLADDNSTAGTEARSKQLATVGGTACQTKDLRARKLEDAREFTKDNRVVYIYHNVIDARGDSALTEGETFEAVCDCIRELVELVQFCVNRLSAGKVWVTADHGFLFQRSAPSETAKSKLTHKPEPAVKVKPRYAIGRDLGPRGIMAISM